MPTLQDAAWFKTEFGPRIVAQVAGTPFTVDMITAFACQETGEIWPALRQKGLPTARILELCVGDTIDANPAGGGRRAFPKTKAELVAAPDGALMFAIARQGLVDMAQNIPAYRGAAARPDKFCHGFGIFQLDLQFFRTEPAYFLERRYADFDAALGRCVGELKAALKRLGWQTKAALGDAEMAAVAIAYNTGRYDPAKGLKQGYFDGQKYYGESYDRWLKLAHSAQATPATRGLRSVKAGRAMNKGASQAPAPKKKAMTQRAGTRPVAPKRVAPKKVAAEKVSAKKVSAKESRGEESCSGKSADEKGGGSEERRRKEEGADPIRAEAARASSSALTDRVTLAALRSFRPSPRRRREISR